MVAGNPSSVPANQQFTHQDDTHYTLTVNLISGQEYLLVPVAGDWNHKYAIPDNSISNVWQGGDFRAEASDNFPAPPQSGQL